MADSGCVDDPGGVPPSGLSDGDHLDDLPGLRKCRAHGLRRFLRPAPYVARVWLGEGRPLRSP